MNQELQAAIELGRALRDKADAEYEEDQRQREYARRQDIMGLWVPYIHAVRAKVPKWAIVRAPLDDTPSVPAGPYDDKFRPMSVHVGENIPPLRAWAYMPTSDTEEPSVLFAAGRWTLYCTEDTGTWIVTEGYDTHLLFIDHIQHAPPNGFYLALAEAADQAPRHQELLDEATRRNQQAAHEKEVADLQKEIESPPIATDPLERIATALEIIARYIEVQATF